MVTWAGQLACDVASKTTRRPATLTPASQTPPTPTHGIPWGTVFPDSGNDGNPGPGPGWLDDEHLADDLHHLADRVKDGVESEVDAHWHLEAVSLLPAGATDPDDQIDIAPDDPRRWGSGALAEVTSQLQDGELYPLTQYFGGTRVYTQAMVHVARGD